MAFQLRHNLHYCEVIPHQHADLFWALRGGKMGLGIVTEIRIRLLPLKSLYGGSLFFEEKDIEQVLRSWIDWTTTADLLVTTSIAMVRFPDVAAIPAAFRGRHLLTLRFAYPGSKDEGIRLAEPLRAMEPVYQDTISELSISEIDKIHHDPIAPCSLWISGMLLNDADQDFVSILLNHVGMRAKTPFSATEIRHLGAATHHDVANGSAVSGRSAAFSLGFVGRNPEKLEMQFRSAENALISDLAPWISSEGNINLMGKPRSKQHVERIWMPHVYKKLVSIRQKYDPQGLFNQSFENY